MRKLHFISWVVGKIASLVCIIAAIIHFILGHMEVALLFMILGNVIEIRNDQVL